MLEELYRRRSVRTFNDLEIGEEKLKEIKKKLKSLKPIDSDIEVEYRLVDIENTNVKNGQYAILAYGERDYRSLLTIGYNLIEMDLFLSKHGIGSCFRGIGHPVGKFRIESYIIMLVLGNTDEKYRKSEEEFKRKDIDEIWEGEFNKYTKETVRLAPSACNYQPWKIVSKDKSLEISRKKELSLIPQKKLLELNLIDLGILLYILESSLKRDGIEFRRILFEPSGPKDFKVANYIL